MKKLFIITILVMLLFGTWQNCCAQQELIADPYPEIPGEPRIGLNTTLPQLVRYIYMLALGAAGFVALLSMMVGAVMYVFSAGNPSKASDAKDRIMSALLGILLLLASVLILRTVSPNLVSFSYYGPKLPYVPPDGNGGDTPTQARACFCGGAFERCYADRNTCVNQCDGYCKMIHNLWTTGLCNIDTTNCP